MVDDGGTWEGQGEYIRQKALAKTNEMQFWLGRHWEISTKIKIEVWKAMVLSAVRYGSEVWFLNKIPSRNLEAIQTKMIKNVMRINRSTTDAFVRGGVGMWELERFRDVAMMEWLGRVLRWGLL